MSTQDQATHPSKNQCYTSWAFSSLIFIRNPENIASLLHQFPKIPDFGLQYDDISPTNPLVS